MSDDVLAGVDVTAEPTTNEDLPSMDDTLAATLADIRSRDEAEGVETPGQPRGPDGKFTTAAQPESVVEPAIGTETIDPAQPAPVKAAPETWRGDAKAKWAELPDWAKDEVLKREDDVLNGFKQRDEHSHLGRQMQSIINPYLPLIQSQGGTPESAVQSLLNTAYILHQGTSAQKAQAVKQMIAQFGVELGDTNAETVNPEFKPFLDRVAQLEAQVTSQRQADYQAQVQTAQTELAEWKAKDSPKYFDQVQADMLNLISSGQARSYADAYNKACRLNDGVFATMQAEQSAAAETKRLDEMAKKALLAKKQVNVRTTPAPLAPKPDATIDDTLRATLADIRARAA